MTSATATTRYLSRATKATLAATLVVVTLGLLEGGLRLYDGASPAAITPESTSEQWKQRWIERHLNQGLEVSYGYERYHPLFGWSTRPNLNAEHFEDLPSYTTNAQGWRSLRDYSYERRAGMNRIVALGESFTFGEHARDADVWTVQLEEQLGNTEVLNLAVNGYGTDQQLRLLEEEGIKYRPEVVVLGFLVEEILRNGLSFRDYAKPMFVLRDRELVLTNSPVPPADVVLAQAAAQHPWSYLAAFIRKRLAGESAERRLDDLVDEQDLLRLTRAILQRMQAVTAAAGARLFVVIIPSPRSMPRVEVALEQWAGEIGYAAINVGPTLAEAGSKLGRPMYDGLYHTALADTVMAAAVGHALIERGWVPPPSDEALGRQRQRFREVLRATPPS